jgi:hypothetical protein
LIWSYFDRNHLSDILKPSSIDEQQIRGKEEEEEKVSSDSSTELFQVEKTCEFHQTPKLTSSTISGEMLETVGEDIESCQQTKQTKQTS